LLKNVFLYLDRTFVITQQVNSIEKLALNAFKDFVIKDAKIGKILIESLFSEIDQCRDQLDGDRELIKSIVAMYFNLQVYYLDFETPFLRSTTSYYEAESAKLLESMDPNEYLQHVIRRMEFEAACCTSDSDGDEAMELGFVEPVTKQKLLSVVLQTCIHSHANRLLERSFFAFADQKRLDAIFTLYSLFKNTEEKSVAKKNENIDKLKAKLGSYIKIKGTEIVSDQVKDGQMVQALIQLLSHVNQIIEMGCENNQEFKEHSKDSLTVVLNTRQNKPAELIALFVDKLLKTSKLSESQVEDQLNSCLALFRMVQGKDIFEAFYGKTLAKRLLLNKSASVDSEKSMLVKLRSECGGGFTSKLEGMFKDIDLSKDIMTSFLSNQKIQENLTEMEIVVSVLTMGYWPTYPVVELVLPPVFVRYQKVFEDFFLSKHSGRRLTWITSLGHCLIHYRYEKINKELVVSLFQTVVLLLFNGRNTLTTKDIEEQTHLSAQDLERTLQSLALAKVKLLKKNPHTKNVLPTDTWTLNPDFSHQQRRIVVNQIQAQESKEEIENTTERVFEDRQYQIDCALVRIMKSEKQLMYKNLVAKLFEVCKFPIQVSFTHVDDRC
jgi:cullin 4